MDDLKSEASGPQEAAGEPGRAGPDVSSSEPTLPSDVEENAAPASSASQGEESEVSREAGSSPAGGIDETSEARGDEGSNEAYELPEDEEDPDLVPEEPEEEESEVVPGGAVAGRDIYLAGDRLELTKGNRYEAHGNQYISNNLAAVETPTFDVLPGRTLTKSSAVFVAPSDWQRAVDNIERIIERRVALVQGPDRAGKWTCAINLALLLRKHDESLREIVQYSRPRSSEISLVEALSSERFREGAQNCVVLLRDCFERGVRREDLETADVQYLAKLLEENDSVLILTADVKSEMLASLAVTGLAAQVDDLHEVLDKNLHYQIEHEGLRLGNSRVDVILDKMWRELRSSLTTPFHIGQFCSRLSGVVSEARSDRRFRQLSMQLAVDVATGGREAARGWFDSLHPNEKLLALLVYLFEGAERRWLETVARREVERFRTEGFEWFEDPRERGLDDARERIHAIEQGGRLEFEDRLYEGEVARQVENRQHLLWEVIEPMLVLEPEAEWSQPWRRRALGVSLGRLGAHEAERLIPALEGMANDENLKRAVVPGYAFQEMVRRDAAIAGPDAFRTLHAWVHPSNDRLMWAAGAALWRVYLAGLDSDDEARGERIKVQALALLRRLGTNVEDMRKRTPEGGVEGGSSRESSQGPRGTWKRIFGCVVQAMGRIGLADPERAAEELEGWLHGNKAILTDLARKAVREVHQILLSRRYKPTEAQKVALLRLVPALLQNASDESRDVTTVFLALRAWLRWEYFSERIAGELLYVATYENAVTRERLRSIVSRVWLDPEPEEALAVARRAIRKTQRGRKKPQAQIESEAKQLAASWCAGTEREAHRIARAVISRCYAVDGTLPSLPSLGKGVAVLDPTLLLRGAGGEGSSAGALWNLLAVLESRLDLVFLRLGENEPIDSFGDSLSAVEPLPRFPGQRLVIPGLEKVRPSCREHVFVLASREPHDLGDLVGQGDFGRLCFLGPGEEGGERVENRMDGFLHLPLSWPPSVQQLEATVSSLENRWARDLASASNETWWELVHDLDREDLDPTVCVDRLEALVHEVDAPLTAEDPHDDPIRRCLALALWLAAADLPTCLQWVTSWLTVEEDTPGATAKRVTGTAAAAAMIRLYTAYPPDPSGAGQAPTLLFETLAESLALQGSDGVETVLRLVDHWLEDPLWADFLAGDVREGRGRLERWARIHLDDGHDLVDRLAERLESLRRAEGRGQSWEALTAAVGRLEALRALEYPKLLPEIAPEQRYAILVVAVGARDEAFRQRLAAIAAGLHRELAVDGDGSEETPEPTAPTVLVPAVYRLGDLRPFWTDLETTPAPERLLGGELRLPGLIGPLFTALEERRDQIATVVLISGVPPLDLDDWSRSAWWEKVRIYGNGAPPAVPGFTVLPQPTRLAGVDENRFRTRTEAAEIAAYLLEAFRPDLTTGAGAPGSSRSEASA